MAQIMTESNTMHEMLTPQEIAKELRVSDQTVFNWLKTGELEGLHLGGKTWRIRRSAYQEFLRQHNNRQGTDTYEIADEAHGTGEQLL